MAESTEAAEKEFEKGLRWIIDTQLTSSWSDKMKMINEEFIEMNDEEIERLRNQLNRLETTDLTEQLTHNDMLEYTIEQLSAEVERLEQRLAIERLKQECGEKTEQIEMMAVAGDEYKTKTAELIERLKQQLAKATNQTEGGD